ncbi:hypothetical protein EOD41_01280 [Mucilaginibacter limnophilus]|uniref:Glycosyl hydrolase n=1 Tax=Mucilaginibacter limnophilus TaxID=1932778 RepID=A0A3S2UP73_9SPHI|nr:glycoside hydrolase family 38 C-terminal domain-containing protein [Mucilaginibacter limnophilus]RVU02602.1 hypothetical protein EOD41_01280 [Mucilaginibacter limnophilus]
MICHNSRRLSCPTKFLSALSAVILISVTTFAQQKKAWFVDGYHGGIWGHYPVWNTRFMADMVKNNPQWKINIEIEPETWDDARVKDPEAYKDFQALMADQSASGMRIEYVNPGYAQSYTYNISGESIIRQFKYGIEKVMAHFPTAQFTTYSSEEPCFTSALPQILTSFGYKYASLKNPNTCWGGYVREFGGELVNWVGPDGTKLITVPRYATEKLLPGSTWQTNAFYNSAQYVNDAFAYGIEHPVGMTLQDAGWRNGLYLGNGSKSYQPTEYTTWRNYFENVAIKSPKQDWKLSQEDVLVSLVWGSQVLQKLAQNVRHAENNIVMAEKIAAINKVYHNAAWPKANIDEAWRNLMLSQHHDCWIVPYNGRPGNTWADKVVKWTAVTNHVADSVKYGVAEVGNVKYIRVYNTLGIARSEWVSVDIPASLAGKHIMVTDRANNPTPSQIVKDTTSAVGKLIFKAAVPSLGYTTYTLAEGGSPVKGNIVSKLSDGRYKLQTDLYTIIINPAKGGIIESLIAKRILNREFVDKASERGFNELRGYFGKEKAYLSSKDKPAEVTVLDDGVALAKIQIKGSLGEHKFTQVLTLAQGQKRIDMQVAIDYTGNPEIGEPTAPNTYKATDNHKGFYNDREKLMVLFPAALKDQKIYKNAPYDVTESKLENTFFTRWDSIKNNVLLNWVDVTDGKGATGIAVFTDHTTNYAHSKDHTLGLTLQYAGVGLWGRNYKAEGRTLVNYSLLPHAGKWDNASVWTESDKWNEPLSVKLLDKQPEVDDIVRSLINVQGTGYEVSSVIFEGNDMLVRLFNAESDDKEKKIAFDFSANRAQLVELNGNTKQDLVITQNAKGEPSVLVSMPRFGFRTIKFINPAKTN